MKLRLILGFFALLFMGAALGWARYQGVRFATACEGVALGINTNSLVSLFHGRAMASYVVGRSGFLAVVYSIPWFRPAQHTTNHFLTNSQAFPLRHGTMVIVVDSKGNAVAYQRINESSLVYDRGTIPLARAREVRTLRELLDALLGQDKEPPKGSAVPPVR